MAHGVCCLLYCFPRLDIWQAKCKEMTFLAFSLAVLVHPAVGRWGRLSKHSGALEPCRSSKDVGTNAKGVSPTEEGMGLLSRISQSAVLVFAELSIGTAGG